MRSTTSLRRMLSDIAKQRRVSRLGVAIKVKEFLRQDTAVFPDSVQTIKLLVAEGNLVAAWTTYEGTQQGPMGPKIAEWWVTWDNMTILRALGHSEWLRRSEPQSD